MGEYTEINAAADQALKWAEAHQRESGGFRGSHGLRAWYFPANEPAWAVKFYLDAHLHRIRMFFDRNAGIFPADVADDDGRLQAILADGPLVWRHRGDPAAMAEHLFAAFDPTFAARARLMGGGFVVAGSDYGFGPHRPHVALAMVALGVRSVIATSFAPAHRAEMIRHGLLPLRPAAGMAPGELAIGDELEIPGLPDMLERNKPVVARNLTCGSQISLHHDLTEREIELVRAGGLLAVGAGAPA